MRDREKNHFVINNRKPPKTTWPMVCVPRTKGSLGVLNLTVQNESLLMKQLHKFSSKVEVPWVQLVWDHYYSRNRAPSTGRSFRGSFWWKDILKLLHSFKGLARINLQNGSTCFCGLIFGRAECVIKLFFDEKCVIKLILSSFPMPKPNTSL